jgi:(1->4)-alpha-D-glucan 1-alpha-D-glucosylmutase
VHDILGRTSGNLFLDDLREAVSTFAWYGALNSLAMTLLKYASPGVPDLYQGQEIIDLSLVDPDNRRPVDYGQRRRTLDALRAIADAPDVSARVAGLCAKPDDGHAKTWLIWQALELRRARPALFRDGGYTPLAVSGPRSRHVVGFARRTNDELLIVATGRLLAQLEPARGVLPVGATWDGTAVAMPGIGAGITLRDVLTGRIHQPTTKSLALDHVFAALPFALLHGRLPARKGAR